MFRTLYSTRSMKVNEVWRILERWVMVLFCLAIPMQASAQSPEPSQTQQKVRHTMPMPGMQMGHGPVTPVAECRNALVAAWNASNTDKLANLYGESAIIILPNGQLVTGRQSIREYFQQLRGRKSKVSLTSEGSESGADLQVDFGIFTESFPTASSASPSKQRRTTGLTTEGKYLMVVKQFRGDWKIQEQVIVLSHDDR